MVVMQMSQMEWNGEEFTHANEDPDHAPGDQDDSAEQRDDYDGNRDLDACDENETNESPDDYAD